jgi:hypothetical protein
MTTAVIGATGRVGSEIVRGVLARGDAVTALVRDPGKARLAFGESGRLHIRATRLDDPRDLTEALDGIRTVFIAMGSIGIEGVLQRIVISTTAGISSIRCPSSFTSTARNSSDARASRSPDRRTEHQCSRRRNRGADAHPIGEPLSRSRASSVLGVVAA